ncbi:MAG TPA: peroxidase family protein, partial [Moraxellaceae bacterium]
MAVWVTWPALTKLGTLGVMAGLLVLAAERSKLFENNLFDVEDYSRYNGNISCDARSLTARTEDGTCNILSNPAEGSVYRRFGRNVNTSVTQGETTTLLSPNPRDVSNSVMARTDFKPATSLNFIAASWIQFMVHDWVDHGPNATDNPIQVPLPPGDALGSGSISVRRTQADPTRTAGEAGRPATYRNHNTHWWDGSQLYGSSKATSDKVRSFVDGKLKVNADGTLPTELLSGKPVTGVNENWWVGLSMLHQLFTREHNAIATMLKQKYPNQSDQWIYDKARLVNSALMAKIHT